MNTFALLLQKQTGYILRTVLIAIFYAIVAKLSLNFATINSNVTPVWPPTGVAISLALLYGRACLPGIWIGVAIANSLVGNPWWVVAIVSTGNALEAYTGAEIFRVGYHRRQFGRHNLMFATGLAALLAPAASSIFGCMALGAAGVIPWNAFGRAILTWWTANLMGAMLIVPFVACWRFSKRDRSRASKWRIILECGILPVLLSRVVNVNEISSYIFLLPIGTALVQRAHGSRAAFFALIVYTFSCIFLTARTPGAFEQSHLNESLLLSLSFITVNVLMVLFLRSFSIQGLKHKITWAFIAVSLASFAIHLALDQTQTRELEIKFSLIAEHANDAVIHSAKECVDFLSAGTALYAASQSVSREEWDEFAMRLMSRYTQLGVHGIGVIVPVSKEQETEFLRQARKEISGYRIHGIGNAKTLNPDGTKFVINYIYPLQPNRQALGLDVSTEKTRYEAIMHARNTGLAQATAKIELLQDNEKRPATVIFLNLPPPAQGWVYSPVILSEFFDKAGNLYWNRMTLEAYDSGGNLVFRSRNFNQADPGLKQFSHPVSISGREYALHWRPTRGFREQNGNDSNWASIASFFCLVLLASIIGNFVLTTAKAKRLANGLMGTYRQQQVQLFESSKFATLGEMAAGVSHEINNPLAIISGKAYATRRSALSETPSTKDIAANMEKIEAMVERIAKIIRGLRAFARDSSQDPMLPMSLSQIVSDTLALCEARANNHGIKMTVAIEDDVSIPCRGYQITQVILNLISNAFDAASESESKWIRVEAGAKGANAYIRVIDSGPGVPAEIREKIMQPFFTTKPPGKGTGLGLSISLGIINDHKGLLQLSPGLPTTFEIILPLQRAEKA